MSQDLDNGGHLPGEIAEKSVVLKQLPASYQPIRRVPSMFPIYLPLSAQHRLFVHTQNILERVCYEYGGRAMPSTLQSRGWDYPEAVELNQWAGEFSKHRTLFSKSPDIGMPLDELFQSIANIRHTAVHRVRVHARGIQKYLGDAERLMTLLGDTEHLERFSSLRRDTQTTLEELERSKHLLKAKLDDVRREVAEQREKLDLSEKRAIAEMVKEDGEYQLLAGNCVEAAIAPSEASFSTAFDASKADDTAYDDTDSTNEHISDGKPLEDGW